MTVGNIVTATIGLYRSRFKDYIILAFQSLLWIVIPIFLLGVVFAVLFGGIAAAGTDPGSALGLMILLGIVFFVLLIYCLAHSVAYSAAISRLTFGELIQMPETPKEAHRFTHRRMWKFIWAGFLFAVILIGAYIGLLIGLIVFAAIGGGLAAALGGGVPGSGSATVISTLISIIAVLVFFWAFTWLIARLFVYDTILAVEEQVAAAETIGLSWQLTNKNAFRVSMVILLAVLVSLPVLLIAQGLSIWAQLQAASSPGAVGALIVLMSFVISLFVSLLTVPLWQVVKSVIYYDLKSRQEGIDLKFSAS